MLEGKELEKAIAQIMKRLRIVNITYIKKIAAQIRKIGELTPSSVNRLVAMSDMNADIGEIRELLRVAAAANAQELRRVFTKAVTETKNDPRFARYLAKYPLKDAAKQRVERFVQSLYRQTAANMYNYSNTTAITQGYSEAIDKAVLAASTGVGSYTETMRDTIREIGHAGLQVQYESGYHRRLDTAVRQNIVDAVNQINKKASIMMGEEINEDAGENIYDAIEISAHARSAPDHEPVQGHVFMKEEWEKLQSGLVSRDIDGRMFEGFRRPIGEWNCRHTPLSFSTKYSQRMWTNEQLHEFIEENQKGCVIDGKHKTLYEAMQMMRDIETAVRREKDTAIAAKEAGDEELRQECQRNINSLVRRYAQIAKASGNAEKRERMTVEGFRSVKVDNNHNKVLTSDVENGILKSEKYHAGITGKVLEFARNMMPTKSSPVSAEYLSSLPKLDKPDSVMRALRMTNPSKDEFNCARCVPAYEMRRRGYDVIATKSPKDWKDDDIGISGFRKMFIGMEWKECADDGKNEIERFLLDIGHGSRVEISLKTTVGSHLFVAENENGVIRFLDPQKALGNVERYFKYARTGPTEFARIDNLMLSDLIKECLEVV